MKFDTMTRSILKMNMYVGRRLKRRLKNFVVVSVVGLGMFYAYRGYCRYNWFNDMSDSDTTLGTKPRVVVLGTGKQLKIIAMNYMRNLSRLGCCTTIETY
jgi:hypothetical protein